MIDVKSMMMKVFGLGYPDYLSVKLQNKIVLDIHNLGKIWEWVRLHDEVKLPHSSLALLDDFIGEEFESASKLEDFVVNIILLNVFNIKEKDVYRENH